MNVFQMIPLPINFDLPMPPIGEGEQNGTLELLQAQAEWIARVGEILVPDAISIDFVRNLPNG